MHLAYLWVIRFACTDKAISSLSKSSSSQRSDITTWPRYFTLITCSRGAPSKVIRHNTHWIGYILIGHHYFKILQPLLKMSKSWPIMICLALKNGPILRFRLRIQSWSNKVIMTNNTSSFVYILKATGSHCTNYKIDRPPIPPFAWRSAIEWLLDRSIFVD